MNTGLLLHSFAGEINSAESLQRASDELSDSLRHALAMIPEYGNNVTREMSATTGIPQSCFHDTTDKEINDFVQAAVNELIQGVRKYRDYTAIINRENIGYYPLLNQVYTALRIFTEATDNIALGARPVVSSNMHLNGDNIIVCGVLEQQYNLDFQSVNATCSTILVPDHTVGNCTQIKLFSSVKHYVPWMDEVIFMYNAVPRTIALPPAERRA